MRDLFQNIEFYINHYDIEKRLFEMGKGIKRRGWLTKDEFLAICLWKSRRPKNRYKNNSEQTIKEKSKACFLEADEILKIKALTILNGVQIPTASAILSVVEPEKYPIIDARCIMSLQSIGIINWKTITLNNWVDYLNIIRQMAKDHKKTPREIEKGLFAYNRINLDEEYRNLYK